MLVIRAEQLDTFQKIADESFEEKVKKYLQDKHGDITVELPSGKSLVSEIDVKKIDSLVKNGVAKAREYGLTWENSLASFVVLMFIVAPNFHSYPSIREILQDESIEPNARIDRLTEAVNEEGWKEAKESYNPEAWDLST